MGDIGYKMSMPSKEEIIIKIMSQFNGIDIYQKGLKNRFDFGKEDIFHFYDHRFSQLNCKIVGTSYDEEFNLELGESYFFVSSNSTPFCCHIPQINYAGEHRPNNEAIIIIEVNSRIGTFNLSSLINLFKPYEGEIIDLEDGHGVDEPIKTRWEILDI